MHSKSESIGDNMYQIVKDLTAMGYRRAGTTPAKNAEKYVYDKFKEVGIKTTILEPINFMRWYPENYELVIISEQTPGVSEDVSIETFPAWYSGSTPKEGITAEVVYVGYGTKSDFKDIDVRGKIILVEGKMLLNFFSTRNSRIIDSLKYAKRYGALAIIGINSSPLDSITYTGLEAQWKDSKNENLPCLSIKNDDGKFLKFLCTRHKQKLTVRFLEISKKMPETSNTVIGILPGKTDDIILIASHLDSTFTGALDNASGNAGLIALASFYAKIPKEEREKTLWFVGWTGHEAGGIGVFSFVEMHEDILNKIATYVCLDGFGCDGYYNQIDGGVIDTRLDEKRGLFITDNKVLTSFIIDAVLKYRLLPAAYVSAKTLPAADLPPLVVRDVPSILVIGKPIWYHTKYDTIDKLTPEQLERTAKAHIEIIDRILETPTKIIKEADGKLLDIKSLITPNKEIKKPSISFQIIPEVPIQGEDAIFVPTTLDSPESIILSFEWDFGDGKKVNQLLMRHRYIKPGVYLVKLKATDNYGNIGEFEKILKVLNKNILK